MSNVNRIRTVLQLTLSKFLYEPYDSQTKDNMVFAINRDIQILSFIDKFSVDFEYDNEYNMLKILFSYNEVNNNRIEKIVISLKQD